MAVYFSRELAKRSAACQLGLTSGALRQLESYDFPNNIQVLQSLLNPAFLEPDLSETTTTANRHLHPAHRQSLENLRALSVQRTLLASRGPCACGADSQELEGVVSRAVRQAGQSLESAQVPEDVFWYAQQVGADLLVAFPMRSASRGRVPMLSK
jgi:transcriptional regulator with GAF, ATPase, and Fis domain